MNSPNSVAGKPSKLGTVPESALFIRETSNPGDKGCFKCRKCEEALSTQSRERRTWTYKLYKFIRAEYKLTLLVVLGILSIAIVIVVTVKHLGQARRKTVDGALLAGSHNFSSSSPGIAGVEDELDRVPSVVFPPSPSKSQKPHVVTVYTLQELNSLSDSATSVVIKSLRGVSTRHRTKSLPVINSNRNVHILEIDAGDVTLETLIRILKRFPEVRTLSLNIDKLCFNEPESGRMELELEKIRHFRIVHAQQCPSMLEWVLSWNIHYIHRFVLCQVDFSDSRTFEALHSFLNGTSSEVEEVVLQDTKLCEGCNFYDLKLDNLRETVEDVRTSKDEEVVCAY